MENLKGRDGESIKDNVVDLIQGALDNLRWSSSNEDDAIDRSQALLRRARIILSGVADEKDK
jgi:hypothetical protein